MQLPGPHIILSAILPHMVANNPYANRWRFWYPEIADWLLENPGGTYQKCAAALGRSSNAVSLIVNTDLFKAYLDERRRERQALRDDELSTKLNRVGNLALDSMISFLEKKRDAVPINTLHQIQNSALDRLGYSPASSPTTQVNIQANGNQQVVVSPISVGRLEEARDVLRRAQEARRDRPEIQSPIRQLLKEAESPSLDPDTQELADDGPLFISS